MKGPSCHCISYPKSGRSWVRYALTQMDAAKGIRFHHDGFEFNDGTMPPLNFSVDDRLHAYRDVPTIIYIDRDPRDVLCSLFHQVTGRFSDFFHYDGTISDFIRHPYFGADNLRRFRAMWAQIATRRSVHCISYEAMSSDAVATVQGILMYRSLPVDEARLVTACEASTFTRMQAVEKAGTFAHPWLRMRNGHPKVRQGRVQGFRHELDQVDIDYLNRVFCLAD